mmetsp:Transcript_23471/g.69292  ORF Transcript_23471/g.69292 Transcript_23471/m.69292 type:complete len:267 (+) Transcript_23471:958-1758(+)
MPLDRVVDALAGAVALGVDLRVQPEHRQHELLLVAARRPSRMAQPAAAQRAVKHLDGVHERLGHALRRHRLQRHPLRLLSADLRPPGRAAAARRIKHALGAVARPEGHELRAAPAALVVGRLVADGPRVGVLHRRADGHKVLEQRGEARERVDRERLHGAARLRNGDDVDPQEDVLERHLLERGDGARRLDHHRVLLAARVRVAKRQPLVREEDGHVAGEDGLDELGRRVHKVKHALVAQRLVRLQRPNLEEVARADERQRRLDLL